MVPGGPAPVAVASESPASVPEEALSCGVLPSGWGPRRLVMWSRGTVTSMLTLNPGGRGTGSAPEGVHHGPVWQTRPLSAPSKPSRGTPSGVSPISSIYTASPASAGLVAPAASAWSAASAGPSKPVKFNGPAGFAGLVTQAAAFPVVLVHSLPPRVLDPAAPTGPATAVSMIPVSPASPVSLPCPASPTFPAVSAAAFAAAVAWHWLVRRACRLIAVRASARSCPRVRWSPQARAEVAMASRVASSRIASARGTSARISHTPVPAVRGRDT